MVREQFAQRHRGERRSHRRVQLVDDRRELCVVGRVVLSVRGIASRHVVLHDLGVAASECGVGPQVGVGLSIRLGKREVVDVVALRNRQRAQFDDLGIVRHVRHGQVLGRLLQTQPVHVHDVNGRQQFGDTRLGFEGVRVGALGHDARHIGTVADDVRDDAGDRRNRGGDGDAAIVRRRPRLRDRGRRTCGGDRSQRDCESKRHPAPGDSRHRIVTANLSHEPRFFLDFILEVQEGRTHVQQAMANARLRSVLGDAVSAGRLAKADTVVEAVLDGSAMPWIQLSECRVHAGSHLLQHDQVERRAFAEGIRRRQRGHRPLIAPASPRAAAHHVQCHAACQDQQIGAQRSLGRVETPWISPEAQENFLHHIGGVVGATHRSRTQMDRRRMLAMHLVHQHHVVLAPCPQPAVATLDRRLDDRPSAHHDDLFGTIGVLDRSSAQLHPIGSFPMSVERFTRSQRGAVGSRRAECLRCGLASTIPRTTTVTPMRCE